jgi:hypothetical protein
VCVSEVYNAMCNLYSCGCVCVSSAYLGVPFVQLWLCGCVCVSSAYSGVPFVEPWICVSAVHIAVCLLYSCGCVCVCQQCLLRCVVCTAVDVRVCVCQQCISRCAVCTAVDVCVCQQCI